MKLGETRVKVKVIGPKASEDVMMLADTGAGHSMISKALAGRLGIGSLGETSVELADGTERTLELARAVLQVGNDRETVRLFVGDSDEPLLGLSALQTFGLKVNPLAHRLEPARQILYAFAC